MRIVFTILALIFIGLLSTAQTFELDNKKAIKLYKKGKLEKAEKLFLSHPKWEDSPLTYYYLFGIYDQQLNRQKLEKLVASAMNKYPNDPVTLMMEGYYQYAFKGNFEGGYDLMDNAVVEFKLSNYTYEWKWKMSQLFLTILYSYQDWDHLIKRCQGFENEVQCAFWLSRAYFYSGQNSLAFKQIIKSENLAVEDKETALSLYIVGMYYSSVGNIENAFNYWDKAIEKYSDQNSICAAVKLAKDKALTDKIVHYQSLIHSYNLDCK